MKLILVCLLAYCFGKVLALRCATADGLSVEDVRKGKYLGLVKISQIRVHSASPVVKKCMNKVTRSDPHSKNLDEYDNFESGYEKDQEHSQRNSKGSSYGSRSNSGSVGNYDNRRVNEGGDSNSYQFSYGGDPNFNNRNNSSNNRNSHDGRQNSSNNATLEKEKACILQCFIQELKMVRKT